MASFISKLKSFDSKVSNAVNSVDNARATASSVTSSLTSGLPGTIANAAIKTATGNSNVASQINSITGFGGKKATAALSNIKFDASDYLGDDIGDGFEGIQAGLKRITDNAPELAGLVDSKIRIIERGAAEIMDGAVGKFSKLREAAENNSILSAFSEFVDDNYVDPRMQGMPEINSGNAKSRIPNPLRDFSSYNYKFTMGVLSAKEFNNPNLYREAGGFAKYVIKSTGGSLEKRYQVLDEIERGGGHGEYFIEDFQHDALIAPNPATGVSAGMKITFKVIEPFSMGNFPQAIVGAAIESGYKNYYSCPFCIRIDFTGWDESGTPSTLKPIYLPLKINQMDMRVTGKGCEYDVQAIPYTDLGLSDNVNKIMTNINAPGNLVHEILQTGNESLTASMNKRIEALEDSNIIPGYDRYIICFPKDPDSILKYLSTGLRKPETTTKLQQVMTEKGMTEEETTQFNAGADVTEDLMFGQENVTSATGLKPVTDMFETLLAFASDVAQMNEIGKSTLVQDDAEGGDQKMSSLNGSYTGADGLSDPAKSQLIRKDAVSTQTGTKGRINQFEQGAQITKSIEKTLLNSEYCKDNATKESDDKGIKKWFRIDTHCYLDENKETEQKIGRPPAVFVYAVIPYETDEAKTLGNGQVPKNTPGLKAAAAKQYDYLYTGSNEDVLRFDIMFNTAFMKTALAGYGNNSGAAQSKAANSTVISDALPQGAIAAGNTDKMKLNTEASATVVEVIASGNAHASRSLDIRRQIAEQFHDSIMNQVTDMIAVEMDIWGDPFFLPQEIGNYAPKQSGASPNTTDDGTMTYTRGEVFVVVNFRTPFDYQESGALMDTPLVIPQFSGLYSVWKVSSMFRQGQFTQTISLMRRPGQSSKSTPGNVGIVQVVDKTILKEDLPTNSKVLESQKSNSVNPNEETRSTNQAALLMEQVKNSSGSLTNNLTGSIANAAKINQNIVAKLSNTGSQASAAITSLKNNVTGDIAKFSSGTTANQMANKFAGNSFSAKDFVDDIGDGFEGIQSTDLIGDTSTLVNNSLIKAVPSFGAAFTDLKSPSGQLGATVNALNDTYNDVLGTAQPPKIKDRTGELKTVYSVAYNDLSPAVSKIDTDAAKLLKNTSVINRGRII